MRLFLFLFVLSYFPSQGQTAKIFTTDIDNFWIAYDSVQTTKDSIKQKNYIQTLYLDKATDGLKDFIKARQHSAKRHLNNILKYPKFWNSVRPNTLEIKSHTKEIAKILDTLKYMYPELKMPSIYFTIGVLNSGGTTTPDKILIGSEITCADKTTDASELNKWLQSVMASNQSVVSIVAHELGHTQQKLENEDNFNLLSRCIEEGSCDFLAELIYKPITLPYTVFGKKNEEKLWNQFKTEMLGKETKNWLYNGNNAPPDSCPDLGYFMGYVICKSYYKNSKNKKKALKEIIELDYNKPETVEQFLKKSKYNGGHQ